MTFHPSWVRDQCIMCMTRVYRAGSRVLEETYSSSWIMCMTRGYRAETSTKSCRVPCLPVAERRLSLAFHGTSRARHAASRARYAAPESPRFCLELALGSHNARARLECVCGGHYSDAPTPFTSMKASLFRCSQLEDKDIDTDTLDLGLGKKQHYQAHSCN